MVGLSTAERRKIIRAMLDHYDEKRAQALFAKLKKNGSWQCPTLTVLYSLTHPTDKRRELVKDVRLAPAWMHPIFRELAEENA